MKSFKCKPLNNKFGIEITDLDVGSLDNGSFRELLQLLYEHSVLVIRDQQLSKVDYLKFGSRFGKPIPHVLAHARMPDFPEMMTITNKSKTGTPSYGAAHWHTDQSYERNIATSTMLYSIKAPLKGGDTHYVNMLAAYHALDAKTQSELENYQVEHLYGAGIAMRPGDYSPAPLKGKEQVEAVPAIFHPLVMKHPVTHKKTLYSPVGTSSGIKGLSKQEAKKILDRIADHAFQDQFIMQHHYNHNDLVVWDTLTTMHTASPIELASDDTNTRVLYRISTRGRPPILEEQAAVSN